ncbi:DUF3238 domain-containing protein [Roseateles sp.]|uniref:DUF3238 domain-containing protein n=1 Tax=Roseateles sp. TaxID=1971397 RepID=UPI003D102EAD
MDRQALTPVIGSLLFGLLLGSGVDVRAQDTVRFVVRAFIPKSHPTSPGAIKAVPGQSGMFMVPDVLPTGQCFDTDHREFSADPAASSRLSSAVKLISGASPTASVIHAAGRTVRRKCATGGDETAATAQTTACHMGQPAAAGNLIQIVVGCSAGNPLVLGAPKIDYGGTITYDMAAKTLAFQATVGNFPSFEAYASLNGGPFKKIFAIDPAPGSTPWALFDAGLGFGSRPLSAQPVKLN